MNGVKVKLICGSALKAGTKKAGILYTISKKHGYVIIAYLVTSQSSTSFDGSISVW